MLQITPGQISLHDVMLIALGLILGFAVINAARWLLGRRRRVRLPEEFLVEISLFARRFERSAEQMRRLSTLMENPERIAWKVRNAEILRSLRQMNRLLQRLNDFFEVKVQEYEHPLSVERELPSNIDDFSRPEEKEKFRRMSSISRNEIASADWDELLNKLIDSEDNNDQID